MISSPLGDSFVHLHVHSEYSLLDGACRVDGLCRRSADEGAPGIALTDHGVMFGAMEFYYAAKEHSLVPIVGCEAYIAPRGRFDKTVRDEAHVTLLAADLVGYRNLVALISKGFLEGYYYKPRIDMDLLAKHHDGLIVLSGCMSSLVAQPFLRGEPEVARKAAREFADIFGDRFYIEIMRHGIPEQDVVNAGLIALARDMNLPLVATNDSHYLERGDARAHDVLLCIQTGKTVADTSRMKFMTDEFYVKSSAEMRALFADVPDACDNTLAIAKRIDIRIPEKTFNIPHFPVPSRAERERVSARVPEHSGDVRAASDRLEAARTERTVDVWVAAPEDVADVNLAAPAEAFVTGSEIVPAETASMPSLFDVGPVHGVGFDGALAKRLALADIALEPPPPAAEHVGEAGAAEDGRPERDAGPVEATDEPFSVVLEAAPPGEDETPEAYLREVCAAGLLDRYGADRVATDGALRERLGYELRVIVEMGFASYFLIVWDFIKFARDRGIPVGPGRGSAVGSLVSYALRITDMDPIKFDLIFERFLNPDRISMPDIDTDFCVERRDEVITYVTEKYGQDRVAQIVTFGTMAARGAINDAGRALAIPLADCQRIAKMIPSGPQGLSIDKALAQIADLRAQYDAQPWVRELIDTARSIEGLARNASTHAAGVVISKDPLVDWAPLVKLGDDDVNTQYDMNWVERIGLLKMDFLGLRNLTVMKNAVDEIRRTSDPAFDLDAIPDDDAATFEMLGRGDTTGVFQLESDGMRRVVTELKPSSLDDVVALVALYRPGPMEWIPLYISNKHGRTVPKYLHPKLVPILSTTYGVACLHAGTPIWYASGRSKPIEDVRPGDEILSADARGRIVPGRVAKVWPSGRKALLRITLTTGTVIECTPEHRFATPAGDVHAGDLRPIGDARGESRSVDVLQPSGTMLLEAWRPARRVTPASPERLKALLGSTIGRDVAAGTRIARVRRRADRARVLGDSRPVSVERVDRIAAGSCYDIQMEDQERPYFVANGVVTHNCYQEQVMQIARDIAGFSMGQADELRKVMGKKQKEKIPVYREKFVHGAVETSGISEQLASEIFAFVEPFAGYGFNKCVHGSTEIQLASGGRMTLCAAYRHPPAEIMAMWADGEIRPHRVARIVCSGSKPLLRLRTRSGKSIEVTAEHRLLTTAGYREAGVLSVGVELVIAPDSGIDRRPEARRRTSAGPDRSASPRLRAGRRGAAHRSPRDREERVGYGRSSVASNGMWCAGTPERDLCEWLIAREIDFEMHKDLGNGRTCDFSFGGVYWEMDGLDRTADYFLEKYGDLPHVVVTPEDFEPVVLRHLGLAHATNGDPIVSIEPCGPAMTYDVEMAAGGPLNFIANGIVSHNSHAVAYGWIAYQTAFLKANHSRAYLAALMTSVKDKTDKLVEYIDEAKKIGIAVLPPDANASLFDFTVVNEEIRFGLAAIKGVGENAVRSIIETRSSGGAFEDLFDVVNRVDLRAVNRKVFEALVKCGAFDTLPGNRAQQLDALDLAIDRASRAARDRESGQFSLFGESAATAETRPALRNVPAPAVLEQLGWEKETLGIFVSGHPLADVQEALVRAGATPVKDLKDAADDAFVAVAGMLIEVRRTITKAQQQMLIAKIEDMTGSVECIVFPKSYPQLQAAFVQDAIVTVRGRLSRRERRGATAGDDAPLEVSVHVNEVAAFVRSAQPARTGAWHVTVSSRAEVDALARLLAESPGKIPVVIHSGRQAARMPRGISESVYVRSELEAIFGRAGVWEGPP